MATIDTLSIDVKASVDKAVSSLKRFSGAMGEVKSANDGAAQATKNTTFAFEASASGLLKAANMLKGAGLKNLAKEYSKMAELVNFRSLEDATKAFLDAADQFAQHGDESTAKFIRDRADLVAKERDLIAATNQLKQGEEAVAAAQARAQEIQETAAKSELAYVELTKKAQLEKADAILKAYTDMAAKIAKENEASDKAYAELTKADKNKKADARIKEILDAEKERQAQMAEYIRIARESEAVYERMMNEEHNRQADSKIKKIIEDAEQATLKKAEADKKAEDAAKKRWEEEKKLSEELKKQAEARNAKSLKELGKAFEGLAKIAPKIESKFFGIFRMFGRIAVYRAVRAAIKAITAALKEGLTNLKAYSKEVGTAFAPAVDNLRKHVLWLKNSIATALRPVLEALMPLIQRLVDWLVKAADFLAQVFSILFGKVDENGRYTRAVLTDLQESNEEAKKLQRTLLGFDEINRLDGNNGNGNSLNTGLMFEQAEVSEKAVAWAAKIAEWVEKIKTKINEIDWKTLLEVLVALKATQILSKVVQWVGSIASILGGTGGLIALATALLVIFGLWGDKIQKTIEQKIIPATDKWFGKMRQGTEKGGAFDSLLFGSNMFVDATLTGFGTVAAAVYHLVHGDFEEAGNDLSRGVKKVGAYNARAILYIMLSIFVKLKKAWDEFASWISRAWDALKKEMETRVNRIKLAALVLAKALIDILNKYVLEPMELSINLALLAANKILGTGFDPVHITVDTTNLDKTIKDLKKTQLPDLNEKVNVKGTYSQSQFKVNVDTSEANRVAEVLASKVRNLGNSLSSMISTIADFFGGSHGGGSGFGGSYGAGRGFASGGFPAMGSLFYAGEAGAEWVGDINGRTGVMNTDQMAAAMYTAMNAALANNPQGGDIYLDGEVIYRNTVRRNNNQVRATGRTALLT